MFISLGKGTLAPPIAYWILLAKGSESCQRLFTNRPVPWLRYEPISRSPGWGAARREGLSPQVSRLQNPTNPLSHMSRMHRVVRYLFCGRVRLCSILLAFPLSGAVRCGFVRLYWHFYRQKSTEINKLSLPIRHSSVGVAKTWSNTLQH